MDVDGENGSPNFQGLVNTPNKYAAYIDVS